MLRSTCPYSSHCKIQFNHCSNVNYTSGIVDDRIVALPCNKMSESNISNIIFAIKKKDFKLDSAIKNLIGKNCSAYCRDCSGVIEEVKTLEISVGRKCNLNCLMCNLEHINDEANENFYKQLLEEAKDIESIESIYMTCEGEPFAYSWIYDYIDSIVDNTHINNIYIITNGTLVDISSLDALNTKLKAANKTLNLTVSICSFVEDTYKIIHGNDKFDDVLNLITHLNVNGMLTQINYVVQAVNLDEYLEASTFLESLETGLSSKLRYLIDSGSLTDIQQHDVRSALIERGLIIAD